MTRRISTRTWAKTCSRWRISWRCPGKTCCGWSATPSTSPGCQPWRGNATSPSSTPTAESSEPGPARSRNRRIWPGAVVCERLLVDCIHGRKKMSAEQTRAGRVWLVTGATAGFGRALTEAAVAAGETVVGAARSPEKLKELADAHPEQVVPIKLDVTDPDAGQVAVDN